MDHQTYQGRMEEQLGQLGQKIDQMADGVKNTAEDVRQEYFRNLETIRSQRDAVQKKLEDLKHSSGQTWEEARSSVDKAWDEVQKSVRNASDRFR